MHAGAVFKIVPDVTAAYSGVYVLHVYMAYYTCDIWVKARMSTSSEHVTALLPEWLYFLARHAIGRGSDPTIDDTVVTKIVDTS